jgi:MerR family transcriptional regulator, copper efflux regulator
MENTVSYSITEAAEMLNLSAKTIRRYIKAGKLPSIKVPTKFGEEYRITEIPEALKQEAAAQAEAQSKVDVISPDDDNNNTLDAQQLYQANILLARQLGMAMEKIRGLEEQVKQMEVKLLEAPRPSPQLPWWKRLLGMK